DNSNSNHWVQKAKENFIDNEKASDKAVLDMFQSLEEVALEIEDKINAFYNKYAEDNNMTLKEAKKMISSKEYSVWRKSLDDYMLDVNNTTIPNDKILLELNTLSTKSQISREEKLLADVYLQMLELASEQEEDLSKVLEDIISTNYSKTISNLKASSTSLSGNFENGKLDKKALSAILNHKWSAKTFSKAIWDNVTNMAKHLKRIITKGFASGSSIQKMVRELKELTQKEKYVVERLVRTECKYFANQSELIAYKENGIKKYVFMGGTEGSINCKCKDYNNKIFNVDDAEVGVNFPPLHPNCKCCIRAYFENSILDNNKGTSLFEEDEEPKENDLNNDENNDIIKEKEANITKLKEDLKIKGVLDLNPKPIDLTDYTFDYEHINAERNHNVNLEEAVSFMNNAKCTLTRWNGIFLNYYSYEGAVYIDTKKKLIRTAFKNGEFDDETKRLMEELKKYE
ncbi:MAG: minor capsid protein, partial [bacterium]